MKRETGLAMAALLSLSASAWAGGLFCCNRGVTCIVPPPPTCPDCGCPCDNRLHLSLGSAAKWIDRLSSCDSCERLKAAQKLGSRLHADFCCEPEVLTALVRALQCDPCWEVRKAAAWSIALQGARVDQGVLSLYLAMKLDPHYLVRTKAAEALDVLLVCRRDCFKELFKTGDELAKQLKGKYKPGSPECGIVFEHCCGAAGVAPATAPTPQKTAEVPAVTSVDVLTEAKPLPAAQN